MNELRPIETLREPSASPTIPRNFWLRKPMRVLVAEANADQGEHAMKRSLTAFNLTMLGVGAIIGAGIFVLIGQAAAVHAGPAVTLSFVLGGMACAFAGMCYAEMASTVPISGSAYTYSYATMGELVAWLIGWNLILEYSLGATAVSIGWSGYLVSILYDFGINIPPEIIASPGTALAQIGPELSEQLGMRTGWHNFEAVASRIEQAKLSIDPASLPQATAWINVPAMFIVGFSSLLLILGIEESAKVNNVIVVLKVSVILLFIFAGIGYFSTANWGPRGVQDFLPPNTGVFGEFGWSGVWRAAGLVFFAYIGFDAVSTAAQETKNPQRDLPIGILGSLFICTLLYVALAFVLTGVVNYKALAVPDPIAVGIDAIGLPWLKPLVKLGALAGISSVVLVMLMAQSRIFMTMSRDGLLPRWVGRLHPRYRTPHLSTMAIGALVMAGAGVLTISDAGELVSIGTLFAFALVCVGVLILRVNHPELPRGFRVPFVWLFAPLGTLMCVGLMAGLPYATWVRLSLWTNLGLLIYASYGSRNSKVVQSWWSGKLGNDPERIDPPPDLDSLPTTDGQSKSSPEADRFPS